MAGGAKKEKSPNNSKKKTVVFLHPDLGIGGAERLVVDAAVGLQNRGHRVVIFTSHCDPTHCFDEARDGTLDVRVRGNTIVPPSILGRFAILCAILRQLHLILHISVLTSELRDLAPDAFFVDQLSAGLPFLSLLAPPPPPPPSSSSPSPNTQCSSSSRPPRILFYCHFPDLLLAQGRAHWWKRLYRVPFDALEEWSMGFADAVAVNSSFTKGVVSRTWPGLRTELRVVYPCVDVHGGGEKKSGKKKNNKKAEEKRAGEEEEDKDDDEEVLPPLSPVADAPLDWKDSEVVLSINRFERKKNVALAIRAYAGLKKEKRRGVKLVIAGGYDNRVAENVSYHAELSALATSLGLRHATTKTVVTALTLARDPSIDVLFLLSVPSSLKTALLRSARLLVYTPAEEHFGIVPLEAMLAGCPVLACDSGGPTETVLEGVTGWLRPPSDVDRWTDVMDLVLHGMSGGQKEEMRVAGPRRVRENFSDVQMAERLEGILGEMEVETREGERTRPKARGGLVAAVVGILVPLMTFVVFLARRA